MTKPRPFRKRKARALRRIGLLAFPGSEMLDAIGPLEVFAKANELNGEALYDLKLISLKPGPFKLSSGFSLLAELGLADDPGPLDTLLVAGGDGSRDRAFDPAIQAWLARHSAKARRVGSICTGAFLLAAGGYLDGRRATTHWHRCQVFRELFPQVQLEPDAIHVRDGRYITSAGVTAGIDMALALVEEDAGRALAFAAARQLVVYARRPGGQSQFSAALLGDAAASDRFDGLCQWIVGHLDQDLRVEQLAARVGMSPRSFARHFEQETGLSPGRFVTCARLDGARRALEDDRETLEVIAHNTGFGHVESLRRSFLKHLSLSPGAYRHRWAGQINGNSSSTEEHGKS